MLCKYNFYADEDTLYLTDGEIDEFFPGCLLSQESQDLTSTVSMGLNGRSYLDDDLVYKDDDYNITKNQLFLINKLRIIQGKNKLFLPIYIDEKYAEYKKQNIDYSNPLWLKRREFILKRDDNKCSICSSNKMLQVHHKVYIRGRIFWDYEDEFLITLCKNCHKRLHKNFVHHNIIYPRRISIYRTFIEFDKNEKYYSINNLSDYFEHDLRTVGMLVKNLCDFNRIIQRKRGEVNIYPITAIETISELLKIKFFRNKYKNNEKMNDDK